MNLTSLKLKIKNNILNNLDSTAKNISIMFIFTSVGNFINFVYHIIMGRLLGPSEYGILASIISFLLVTTAITDTTETTLARYTSIYLAENNVNKIKILFYLITKRILFFTVTIFIIILIFLNKFSTFLKIDSVYPLIFLGVMIIGRSLISIGRGALQGIKKFKSLGVNLVLEVLLKLILGIILVYFGLKANGAIFGFMLAILFTYLLIFFHLKKVLRNRINSKSGNKVKIDIKRIYRSIFFIFISTIFISLFSHTNIILVKHFFSSYETGYYSAAAQIGKIVLFFSIAVGVVIFPRLSEKFTKREELQNTLTKGLVIIFIISIPILVLYFFCPGLIVKFIYGNIYLDAASLIFRYGIFMTFISLIYIQIYYFISIEKYWYLIYLLLLLVEQITLIWVFNKSLELILLILILNSIALFSLNFLLIFLYNKKLKR